MAHAAAAAERDDREWAARVEAAADPTTEPGADGGAGVDEAGGEGEGPRSLGFGGVAASLSSDVGDEVGALEQRMAELGLQTHILVRRRQAAAAATDAATLTQPLALF